MTKNDRPARKEFLNSFNYFRGIAILLIVAGHCFGPANWDPNTLPETTFVNLIKGGTSLFVFISGFLFHHIFYGRFKFKKFLSSKVKNVLTPYLFMSFVPIILAVYFKGRGSQDDFYFFDQSQGIWAEYIKPTLLYIWTGNASPVYWYIPFVMVLFCLSPLFIAYIRLNIKFRMAILALLLVIPVVIHRPEGNLSLFQSIFYFAPVYLLGIACSISKETIYEKLKGKDLYLLIPIVSLAVWQAVSSETVGNFRKAAFDITEPDLMVIQKCLLCLFFMVFLHRFESANLPALDKIASASFAIYFLHPVIIELFKIPLEALNNPLQGALAWIIWTPMVTVGCYCTAATVKWAVPNLSRRLIGW